MEILSRIGKPQDQSQHIWKYFLLFVSFLSEQFGDKNQTIILDCITELVIPNKKIIRCHPNYQGKGEWGDWVLLGCDNSRKLCWGKMYVFLPDQYNRQCPSWVVCMIVAMNKIDVNVPILVLWVMLWTIRTIIYFWFCSFN